MTREDEFVDKVLDLVHSWLNEEKEPPKRLHLTDTLVLLKKQKRAEEALDSEN
jgi:hypothetical protein